MYVCEHMHTHWYLHTHIYLYILVCVNRLERNSIYIRYNYAMWQDLGWLFSLAMFLNVLVFKSSGFKITFWESKQRTKRKEEGQETKIWDSSLRSAMEELLGIHHGGGPERKPWATQKASVLLAACKSGHRKLSAQDKAQIQVQCFVFCFVRDGSCTCYWYQILDMDHLWGVALDVKSLVQFFFF